MTDEVSYDTDRVLTVPNILSFLRLLGVPLFLWLLLDRQSDVWAVVVLAISGLTDLLDGRIARAWHQVSRLGQMLDPVADRLYILATIIGFALRDIIPWWLVGLLIGRELMIVALVPFLRRRGYTSLPVHLVGKIATFCLLYAFPLVLLGVADGLWALIARVIGWAFVIWGTGLYWWAGLLYVRQTVQLLHDTPAPEVTR